ncbi:transport permease protein [Alicyclobacillus contaminans]|uniref:ABC transporter permease n=1 Tax=Alicyclobacillus contaminans TaxID=392016 RepID=UPI00040ED583|nr:ABC transporter permease [Alicyclobacillus contaminans]GMA49818.1 transport permease protein [Alicyclobacillus contaminans]
MRLGALILRIVRQFWHDKRTLGLMFIAPLLVLWLVSLVFNGNAYHPHVGTVQLPAQWTAQLSRAGADVSTYDTAAAAESALKSHELDAYVAWSSGTLQVRLEGSDPSINKSVLLLLQQALSTHAAPVGGVPTSVITYLYGSADMSTFDGVGPVLIGVFAFFFVFLIAGIAFLRERTSGTLERLMATPLRRWEMVLGYVIGFGIFTTLQSAVLTAFAVYGLGLMMNGQLVLLLLVTLLLSMTALTLGTLLSSFANSEFQMMQFIPLVIVPQIFLSGLFNMDNMAVWLRWLGKMMPLSYAADALRDVMIRGRGLTDIYPDLLMLLAFSLVFMVANTISLRKYRRV